jgi:8-amino-7-oxononanoate synthase
MPSFCSNDYLGLAALPAPAGAAGAGASRLIAGDHAEHHALEQRLATWLGAESALLFTSGYAANVGAIGALARPGDLLVSDALNHASIIDGARLSRAKTVIVPHLDLSAVADALAEYARGGSGRAWVVVESYYSMDADGPDLRRLREVCDDGGAALVVDEAHALGVLGPGGRGRAAEAGIRPDVLVGTLGKALGSQGAFVAGHPTLRAWLWNRARSFVFSTGLAPVSALAALRSLDRLEEFPDLGRAVLARAEELRAALRDGGLSPLGFGHIVPLVVGAPESAVRAARALADVGIDVQAVRPPTVAEGTSRLRMTVSAAHSAEDVARAARAVGDVLGGRRFT